MSWQMCPQSPKSTISIFHLKDFLFRHQMSKVIS